jgi:DNA-directed RNA polymerase subunit RPC12/RpoP
MDIQVEQGCPQCGAPVTLSENDRLLTCPYCGVKNFLQTGGPFRYVLPDKLDEPDRPHLLYAPYIRLKSNIFHVLENTIAYKILDTTQLGFIMPGLPPTLGMRPQAMRIGRLTPKTKGRFLRLSIKARVILEKAVHLSRLSRPRGATVFHRAYIGDTLSFIYLPLNRDETHLVDSVTDTPLVEMDEITSYPLKGTPFNPRWQVHFLPTLCPRCGWNLDGEGDCLVPVCSNCDTAWEITDRGLQRLEWHIQPGDRYTGLYLPFWKVQVHIPALKIYSFTDFIRRTNQPMVPKPKWQEKVMSFWIPAFKLRPKIFLQVARGVTLSQWQVHLEEGHVVSNLYPANLPGSEARQAIKVVLAASTTSRKNIFPHLPETRIKNTASSLVYLPFVDQGHDWVQPQTGAVVAKSVLRFGRNL